MFSWFTNNQIKRNKDKCYMLLSTVGILQVEIGAALVHSYKKQKDNLEDSWDQVLFAAELEFPRILVPRVPQKSSNANIECVGKSKQLYCLCDQLLGALIYIHFNLFLIGNACCKLCNMWLLLFENNSRSYYYTEDSQWRKNIVEVIGWQMTI